MIESGSLFNKRGYLKSLLSKLKDKTICWFSALREIPREPCGKKLTTTDTKISRRA